VQFNAHVWAVQVSALLSAIATVVAMRVAVRSWKKQGNPVITGFFPDTNFSALTLTNERLRIAQ
jgi:hypothetical protein